MHSAGEASFATRRARREDPPAIAAVNVASGRVAWAAFLPRDRLERSEPPVERWEERLASDGVDGAWVALADGEIVGFVTTRPCWEGSETGEVTGLYTHPDVWGKASAGRCSSEGSQRSLRVAAERQRSGPRSATAVRGTSTPPEAGAPTAGHANGSSSAVRSASSGCGSRSRRTNRPRS